MIKIILDAIWAYTFSMGIVLVFAVSIMFLLQKTLNFINAKLDNKKD